MTLVKGTAYRALKILLSEVKELSRSQIVRIGQYEVILFALYGPRQFTFSFLNELHIENVPVGIVIFADYLCSLQKL